MVDTKFRILYILPSLANKGPIIVALNLVKQMMLHGHDCTVFYFDEICEITFPCRTEKIGYGRKHLSRYDIVHSHGLRPDIYVSIYKSSKRKTKYISTLHNYMHIDFKYQYNSIIASIVPRFWIKCLKRFDRIITLSNDALVYYSNYINSNKLVVAYNTVLDNNDQLSIKELEELQHFKGTSIIIGVIALLTHRKGVDQLINAITDLPDYKLFIIGDGKSKRDLQSQVIKNGITNRVYFAGYRHNARIWLKHFDICALPSRSEGFPLALLEAAKVGVPTILSDIPVHKEIFTDNEVAFFELENIESLKTAIKKAYSNKGIGKHMKNVYWSKYSPECFYKTHLDIYGQI